MTNKEIMQSDEIIKALECCIANDCAKCKAYDETNGEIVDCLHAICRNALDLINRQQAENEMLKDLITYQKQEIKEKEQKYNQAVDDMFGLIETTRNEITEAKSEARKEFADIVKTLWANNGGYEFERKFYNLVKEITEAKDAR